MNNSELNAILKKAKVPERPNDFWELFPRQVTARLNRERVRSDGRAEGGAERGGTLPFLIRWGIAAMLCASIAVVALLHHGAKDSPDVLASVKVIDETLAMFPHRVRAIVQDEHGLKLILSEQSDVPTSAPLYVRICDGKHCSSLVTFSGQEVQFAGQKLTVLADPHGGIILEGNKLLWSSTQPIYAGNHLKIEAKNLSSAPM